MNSRAYRFILPLNVPAEVPSDFAAALGALTFERGVFLPQADTDWYRKHRSILLVCYFSMATVCMLFRIRLRAKTGWN